MSKFYMKLPEEVIDFALNQLSRDVKRKVRREKRTEGKILMALNMSASKFADAIYNYQKSGMIFSEDTEYEQILASYNSENCIINTVLVLKKCCDGTFDQRIAADFIKSDEFKKTIAGSYDNYDEESDEPDSGEDNETETETEPLIVQEIPDIPENSVITEMKTEVKNEPPVLPEKTESSAKKKKAKDKTTVYYIGNIEMRGTFYNFKPQYTLEVSTSGKKLVEMYQLPEKFPKFGSINLSYVGNKSSQEVLDNLDLNLIYAINCVDILEENINIKNGELNEVNIKIDLQKEFDSKRNSTTFFKKISELRIFRIVRPDDFIPDRVLFRDEIEISDDFSKGELVLLHRQKDSFSSSDEDDISGPYRVDKMD
ncbi:MAG: hypothetical protein K2G14_07250 [Ruminococcus sp.]|nr:hypothetical protein [Ruminococcus sp.]